MDSQGESTVQESVRRTAIAVLATCFGFNIFGRVGDTYIVLLKPLQQDFGWSRSQLAGVFSIYLLSSGLFSSTAGLLVDRLGLKVVYTAGLGVIGLAFVAAGRLQSLWHFYLVLGAMLGLGVGLTGMAPAT